MNAQADSSKEVFRPRLIVWQLTPFSHPLLSGNQCSMPKKDQEQLPTQNCLLVIESIVRTSKPIVVLVGEKVFQRSDLYDIVAYGMAFGLKMIIEALPSELSIDVLRRFSPFGPRVFRVLLNGCIIEDPSTRYRQSREFSALTDCVQRLKSAGYEVHLSAIVTSSNLRELAFYHDYAIRCGARGIYYHLWRPAFVPQDEPRNADKVVDAICRMKHFSPKEMYVSPQCVRYTVSLVETHGGGYQIGSSNESNLCCSHLCLGGKTFAFINVDGTVQVCKAMPTVCGNLLFDHYDFQKLWNSSSVFQYLRENQYTCTKTRSALMYLRDNQQAEVVS